jgi:CheY-like chemotaxis protein
VHTGSDVLVVEDDKDIRDSVVEILREEGYDARGFSNGAEALSYLRTGVSPRVILLDVMMPVMDGWEFRLELEKEASLASIPVILLTADGNAKHKALTMRAVDGLTKPVRLDELLAAVQRYCRPEPL